ncbi:epimerase [Niallia circulans]|uniref:PhzF family phenazine biosynthesis protein n=1 Tax=Shouchella clausii TaxID=79880 RepID=UPI000BA53A1D|nr:PhzF family phenazine biosynthesis protein [Shouchella clausii]MCM3551035.1 PhzF family phenazine biosynthesis protein [Shouchella clausii]PAF12091.1 epimerase [Shouchella clausii]SPU21126.1 epimerase [Niallia circulans]
MYYYVIDSFTETRFGGNPAGVVIHKNLEHDFMQKFATEVRFSETAFVKRLENNRFEVKFFTPNCQVDLCGHATVAAFKALLDSELIEDNRAYVMETLAGALSIEVAQSFIVMEQAEPRLGKTIRDYAILSNLFEIDKSQIGDNQFELIPQTSSTGVWDLMLPIRTKDVLYTLKPNFEGIAAFAEENHIAGIHAFTLDTTKGVAESRNFCPYYGINEEAATGTSTGALTYYLYKNNVLNDFDHNYVFIQGLSMDRPSTIVTKMGNHNQPKIKVAGKARILSKGELY